MSILVNMLPRQRNYTTVSPLRDSQTPVVAWPGEGGPAPPKVPAPAWGGREGGRHCRLYTLPGCEGWPLANPAAGGVRTCAPPPTCPFSRPLQLSSVHTHRDASGRSQDERPLVLSGCLPDGTDDSPRAPHPTEPKKNVMSHGVLRTIVLACVCLGFSDSRPIGCPSSFSYAACVYALHICMHACPSPCGSVGRGEWARALGTFMSASGLDEANRGPSSSLVSFRVRARRSLPPP